MAADAIGPKWKLTNWDRPWDWFNTQSSQEQDYFRKAWKTNGGNGSQDENGVYHLHEDLGINDWVVLTRWQKKSIAQYQVMPVEIKNFPFVVVILER